MVLSSLGHTMAGEIGVGDVETVGVLDTPDEPVRVVTVATAVRPVTVVVIVWTVFTCTRWVRVYIDSQMLEHFEESDHNSRLVRLCR